MSYTFTFSNDDIRKLVPFELTDNECDEVMRSVGLNIDNFIIKYARKYRFANPISRNPLKVTAELERQVWSGPKDDYAINVGSVYFPCQDALDTYPLSELPPNADYIHDHGYLSTGDDLFFTSVSLSLVEDWDGPFECYVDYSEYERYLDERVKREYGCTIRDKEE